MTTLEERVAVLETRAEISELRARYAWLAARSQFSTVADLFTEDVVFEAPGGPGHRTRVEGRESFRTTLGALTSPTPAQVVPIIANETIEIDGDEGTGTCLMHSPVTNGEAPGFCGYYHDRFRRVDGRWLFSERLYYFYLPYFEPGPGGSGGEGEAQ